MSAPRRRNESESEVLARIEKMRTRRPKLNDETITLAHGAGGKASAALVDNVFVEAFANPALSSLGDGAQVEVAGQRVAMSTDTYVVNPIFFPGGSIGDLAVNGTVNDLAMCGAKPLYLTCGFVLEEGLEVTVLKRVVEDMRAAAEKAGVVLVSGDTKVVPTGSADKVFINTAGVGIIPEDRHIGAAEVKAGDKIILSSTLADHGMSVMLARGDLAIEGEILSDTREVASLTEAMYSALPAEAVHWLRDATRGGLGTVTNELAQSTGFGVVLDDDAIPVKAGVRGACDLLGIDPLYVANEGCFTAVVDPAYADKAVEALKAAGADAACVIGTIVEEPGGVVALRTGLGGTRIVDMLVGDPLPRIC